MKKQLSQAVLAAGAVMTQTLPAMANAPEGAPDYSGITALYYALIAIVLVYGVYDTFFKKS